MRLVFVYSKIGVTNCRIGNIVAPHWLRPLDRFIYDYRTDRKIVPNFLP